MTIDDMKTKLGKKIFPKTFKLKKLHLAKEIKDDFTEKLAEVQLDDNIKMCTLIIDGN